MKILLCVCVLLSVCAYAQNELLGAGATFPYPFYSKIFDIYHKNHGVKVNYQGIGSGGGIKQLLNKTVHFGGTDAFMSDKDLTKSADEILHIPTCIGAVAVTYNLPGITGLNLDADTVAKIFMGKITSWSAKEIVFLNPELKLPAMKISVIRRSDGSGTTHIFTDFLTKANSEWAKKLGAGKSVAWPAGIGAKGNAGIAGFVKKIPGSIGYVELIYAIQNNMPLSLIKNRSGNFIKPSKTSASIAANVSLPDDTRISVTDTDAAEGYPISSFTWIIFYKDQKITCNSIEQARENMKLLWWIIHEGQRFAEALDYAPIPEAALEKAEKILKSAHYGENSIL